MNNHINPLMAGILSAHTRPMRMMTITCTPRKPCIKSAGDLCNDCSPNCPQCGEFEREELLKADAEKERNG